MRRRGRTRKGNSRMPGGRGEGDGGKVGKKEVWEFEIPTEEDCWIPNVYVDSSLQIIKVLDTSASPINEAFLESASDRAFDEWKLFLRGTLLLRFRPFLHFIATILLV
jgi:hypothetical protein